MSDNPLKPLGDGQVEDVAGGYLFNANDLESGGIWRLEKPYQVIDDKGNVIERFNSHVDAKNFAKDNGYSTTWLSWPELQKLRETGSTK